MQPIIALIVTGGKVPTKLTSELHGLAEVYRIKLPTTLIPDAYVVCGPRAAAFIDQIRALHPRAFIVAYCGPNKQMDCVNALASIVFTTAGTELLVRVVMKHLNPRRRRAIPQRRSP